MDERIAHLGFIQGVINRMGNNSFLIKGWTVTLIAAIFALSADKANTNFVYLAFFPLFVFWWLDTFFLHQEKMYRKLYEKVADGTIKSDSFTMNASALKREVDCFVTVAFSKTLLPFYGAMLLLIVIFMWKILNLIHA